MFWAIGGAWNSGSGDYAHDIFRQGSTVNDASADVNMGSRELTQDYHAIRTVDDNQLNTGDIFRSKTSGGIYSCYYHAVTIAWECIGSLTLTSFSEYHNLYGGAAWEERAS